MTPVPAPAVPRPAAFALRGRALLGVLVLAAALRLLLLTDKPMWSDETSSLVWAKGHEHVFAVDARSADLGHDLPLLDVGTVWRVHERHHPPLYGLVLNLWMRTLGATGDFALKLLSVLLGVLSVWAVAKNSRDLHGDHAAAWTALLAACSPFLVEYSQEVNHYALAACLTACSAVLYYRFLGSRSLRDGAALTLVNIAALYSHYYFALALLAQGVGALAFLREPSAGGAAGNFPGSKAPSAQSTRRQALAAQALLLAPFALTGLAFLPYLPSVRLQLLELTAASTAGSFGGFWGENGFFERLQGNLLMPWLGEYGSTFPRAAGLCLAALAVLIVALGVRAEPARRLRFALAVNAALPTLAIFTLYLLKKKNTLLWPRYGLFFVFALYVPVGKLLSGLRLRARAAVAAVALAAMSVGLAYYFADYLKEDWRGAAQAIASNAGERDRVLVFQPGNVYELAQYLHAENRLTSLPLETAAARATVQRVADGAPAVFLVVAWAGQLEQPRIAAELLGCAFEQQTDLSVYNVQVTRFSGPRPAGQGCEIDNAFTVPNGDCALEESDGPAAIAGWVDLPSPDATVALYAGDRLLSRPTLQQAAPGEPPLRRSFEARLDLSQDPVGALVEVSVRVARPHARPRRARSSLACLRRPAIIEQPHPGSAVERGNVEVIAESASGKTLRVTGWAFSTRGTEGLRLLIDDVERGRTREHGLRRDDVAAELTDVPQVMARYSGFLDTVDANGLAPGSHKLALDIVHPDHTTARVAEREFELEAAPH